MAKVAKEVLIIFDPVGNTIDVWFGKPRKAICEETEEEFIIKKDARTGEVIGFEKFNAIPDGEEIPPVKLLVKKVPEIVVA